MPLPSIAELNVTQGTVILVTTWIVWRVLKKWTAKTPFEGVPGPESVSYFTGVASKMFHANAWDYHEEMARKYPRISKIPLMMGSAILMVSDPAALSHIFIKEEDIWEESDDSLMANNLVFGPGLLSLYGDQHRKQRKLMNPLFSAAHMRDMTPAFYHVCHKLCKSLGTQVLSETPTEIDASSWMTRAALELLGQSGMGTSFDSLEPDATPHVFATSVKALMQGMQKLAILRFIVPEFCVTFGPAKFRRFILDSIPWKDLHSIRDMVDTLHNTCVEVLDQKRRAMETGETDLDDQVGNGKDIVTVLLKANEAASESEKMSDYEILAQMCTFAFAGMDTTSNASCRILQLLSVNLDIQERARAEILEAKKRNGGGDLSYDEINQLPLLDAIIRETLRAYAPIPLIMRQARKDNMLPLLRPFKSTVDGKNKYEVFIPKGSMVLVSVMASNTDVETWGPDAAEWKPDRWLSPLPESVSKARVPGIYSNQMTFIAGHRSCIGFKFSQLEMKILISLILESFKLEPTEKEISWQMVGITQPAVVEPGQEGPPPLQMPILISRINPERP